MVHSRLVNIYHCTVHKAGSQWIRKILSDERILRHSGLHIHHYQSHMPEGFDTRKVNERKFEKAFPEGTIVTPLYIDYENYKNFPKPKNYRTIFIMRDPRDLVISHYFSKKYSHELNPLIKKIRERLISCPLQEGIIFIIDYLKEDGSFDALKSWTLVPKADKNTLVLRYESLIENKTDLFQKVFSHLNINMSDRILTILLEDYNFERLSKGRKPGLENKFSHYRKGIHGDWKNYFNLEIKNYFLAVTNNLLEVLGYETDSSWQVNE